VVVPPGYTPRAFITWGTPERDGRRQLDAGIVDRQGLGQQHG
jgi:hypothetical protein